MAFISITLCLWACSTPNSQAPFPHAVEAGKPDVVDAQEAKSDGNTALLDGGVGSAVDVPTNPSQPDTSTPPTPPTCKDACEKGNTSCRQGMLDKCVVGQDGCTVWGESKSCAAPQTCSAGKTACECPTANACGTEGDAKCSGDNVQTCTSTGGCLAWGAAKTCGPGERCIGAACTNACPKQSAANLVPNAGFDQGLGGWEGDLGGEDASNCPLSKSLLLVGTPGGDGVIMPASLDSPCFQLPGGRTHNFGAAFKRATGGKVACYLYVWPDSASCSADADSAMRLVSIDDSIHGLGTWKREMTTVPGQPGQTFARVNCQADGKGLVDEVFVSADGGF